MHIKMKGKANMYQQRKSTRGQVGKKYKQECERKVGCLAKRNAELGVVSRRNASAFILSLSAVFANSTVALKAKAEAESKSFLRSTGAKGLLVDEEEKLIKLRENSETKAKQLDAEARRELEEAVNRARLEGEKEAKRSFENSGGSKLCATPYGIDIVGITEGIALVGALVGGVAAKARKDEVQKLNDQLRRINVSLRKQARSGTVYAPGLVYAPPPQSTVASESMETITMEPVSAPEASEPAEAAEPEAPEAPAREISEIGAALKSGRRLLEQKKGAAALVHFEKARMLSRSGGTKVQERRAERGLAAAARLQKQYQRAIGHLFCVLDISNEIEEYTGDADAYGTIADIYTELGDLEKAASYYDLYIERMQDDNGSD